MKWINAAKAIDELNDQASQRKDKRINGSLNERNLNGKIEWLEIPHGMVWNQSRKFNQSFNSFSNLAPFRLCWMYLIKRFDELRIDSQK